jgi:hypothetical protein
MNKNVFWPLAMLIFVFFACNSSPDKLQNKNDRIKPYGENPFYKIYSGRGEEHDEAAARMYRIIFSGGASARFHRPHPLEGSEDHYKTSEYVENSGFGALGGSNKTKK